MEEKKKSVVDGDKEIVFSKAIKAGKRIYYLDVKKNRKDEMILLLRILAIMTILTYTNIRTLPTGRMKCWEAIRFHNTII